MQKETFDLIVIGSGPGGYVGAIRAAQLGLKTAVIEEKHLGGVCLNWGCIPTKALLKASEVYHTIQTAKEFGIEVDAPKINFVRMIERSRHVASQLSKGIQHLLKKNKVTVFEGRGRLLGEGKVEVDAKEKITLSAKHILLATGARPRPLPNLPFDGKVVWSSKEAMTPENFPKELLIVGSGAIGIEFASFYNMLGAKVHVVELKDQILPQEDAEIAAFARSQFEKRGIVFHVNSTLETAKIVDGRLKTMIKTPEGTKDVSFDRVIVAIGILPNTEDLGLEKTKIKLEKGHVVTNAFSETGEKGVYAIGDITGAPWLAHKASHEAVYAVEHMAGKKGHTLDPKSIPGCTYSFPQIASIGFTEAAAKEKGYSLKVGRFPYYGNGKAIALGEPEGLIKTIFDAKTGELLGAHMVGAEVTEMIQGFAIAKTLETTEEELMQTVFPHPTLSEMMHESTLNAFERTIHL